MKYMYVTTLRDSWLVAALWVGCWAALPVFSVAAMPAQGQVVGGAPAAMANLAVLTTVSQVQALSQEKAATSVPVRLRGVVTAFSGWKDYYFLQDATGGIAINRDENAVVHRGDEVEVEGISDPGLFRSSVTSKSVRMVGRAAMPQVTTSTYADLEGGSKDAEWVRVRGVVHSATIEHIWDKRVLVLSVDLGGGMINARIPNFSETEATRLVDAVVEIEGVCGTVFNDKRQYTGLRLFVPSLSEVEVKEPALSHPYDLPTSPVRSLLQFRPDRRGRHRVKIAGIVTYQQDGHTLYVQEGGDGIRVSLVEEQNVPIGSRIEALGFSSLSGTSPLLMSAQVKISGPRSPLPPVSIRGKDFVENYKDTFLFAPYDGQLVQVQGEVISPLALPNEDAWLLQDGDAQFVASLRRRADGKPAAAIMNGSTLSLTGVMSVTEDPEGQPQAFRILLRSPADLVMLSKAPWWTPMRLAVALGVLLTATMGAVFWTMSMKREVRLQTGLLRDSERRFRSLAEHDSLTGLANRSHLHEKLREALEQARQGDKPMGLVMLDLDYFKQVNDTFGHSVGDQLLCIVADRIRTTVRRSDVVARMGGDEFVILLTSIADEKDVAAVGAKLVANIASPVKIGGKEMMVSVSVGICTYPSGGATEESLLQHADEAMYQIKTKGRNNFRIYEYAAVPEGAMTTSLG